MAGRGGSLWRTWWGSVILFLVVILLVELISVFVLGTSTTSLLDQRRVERKTEDVVSAIVSLAFFFALPMLVLFQVSKARGLTRAHTLWGLLSFLGLIIGLLVMIAMPTRRRRRRRSRRRRGR